MTKKHILIIISLWIVLGGVVMFSLGRIERSEHAPGMLSFLENEYLATKKTARLKELNLLNLSSEGYDNLFRAIELGGHERVSLTDSLEYYSKLVDYMPKLSEARAMLAFCYYYQGDKDAAAKNYLIAIQLEPRFFWNYYNLAAILWEKGEREPAMKIVAHALSLNPRFIMEDIYSSKVYRDILGSSSHKDFDIMGQAHKGYQVLGVLVNERDPDQVQKIFADQVKVRFF